MCDSTSTEDKKTNCDFEKEVLMDVVNWCRFLAVFVTFWLKVKMEISFYC